MVELRHTEMFLELSEMLLDIILFILSWVAFFKGSAEEEYIKELELGIFWLKLTEPEPGNPVPIDL